jgi:hypothetical protein
MRLRTLVAILSLGAVPASLQAQGWIEPSRPVPSWGVEKLRSTVSVTLQGRIAQVTVEEWSDQVPLWARAISIRPRKSVTAASRQGRRAAR